MRTRGLRSQKAACAPSPLPPRAGPSQPPTSPTPPPPPVSGLGSVSKTGAAAADAVENKGESSPQSVSFVRSPVLLLLRLVNRVWWFRVWGLGSHSSVFPPPPSLSDPFPFVFPDASGGGTKIGVRTRSAGNEGTFEGSAAASGDRSTGWVLGFGLRV